MEHEYDDLRRIKDLVQDLWDAVALFCLEQGPLRYSDLHRRMEQWSGDHVSTSNVTRSRARMLRKELIAQVPDGTHEVYAMTDAGREHLQQVRTILRIARRIDPDAPPDLDDRDDGPPSRR